jgi:hypothetical protein
MIARITVKDSEKFRHYMTQTQNVTVFTGTMQFAGVFRMGMLRGQTWLNYIF